MKYRNTLYFAENLTGKQSS